MRELFKDTLEVVFLVVAVYSLSSRHLIHIFGGRRLFVGTAGTVKGGRVKGWGRGGVWTL